MIQVHKFGPAFGLPDASPFVTKVETYLRITGQTYEVVTADVRKAPRGQLPVVLIDDKRIPDSTAIVDFLEGKRSEKLDAHLDEHERAIAFAFKSMLEEHLYFGMLYLRWATEDGWKVFEPNLRSMLGNMGVPGILRGMIAKKARKQVTNRAKTQGIGRASHEEIVGACKKILDAFAIQLGEKAYFCGKKPTTFDATTYAFAAGALCPAFDNEVSRHARSKENLVRYEARLKEQYWQ